MQVAGDAEIKLRVLKSISTYFTSGWSHCGLEFDENNNNFFTDVAELYIFIHTNESFRRRDKSETTAF